MTQSNIKLYQIDTNFYELRTLASNRAKIDFIINYHIENFESENGIENNTTVIDEEDYSLILYVFDEVEQESKWKRFLPREITQDHGFNIINTSFALFIVIHEYVFCIIGGKGISVIKRFINHSFGLDLFEKFAEPELDIVHSLTTRGITGALSSEERTYRSNQKLQDALNLGSIPIKINLVLRDIIKDSIFDFIEFNENENVHFEIGSSFSLKMPISFENTLNIANKAAEILDSEGGRPLSRFERIRDSEFIEDTLQGSLFTHLRDDMERLNSPNANTNYLLDYDFIHPGKYAQFYECDTYKVFLRNGRNEIVETRDRTRIYFETLAYMFNNVERTNFFEFRRILAGIKVRGYLGDVEKTVAPFVSHVSCEIRVTETPYFLLDTKWYTVRGDFLEDINSQCSALLNVNDLPNNPLNEVWNTDDLNEGEYNLLYRGRTDFLVLDKMLGHNIELCDLLYETDEITYLIHVKEGFDAKMRDVTNQVTVSSHRLWNDLNSDRSFIREVYERFNRSENNTQNINYDTFSAKFDKKIEYVIAYRHGGRNVTVAENIQTFQSNIAKFSLIMCMKEMQSYSYPLKVIEIGNGIN
uniref:DUF6119 family protein n=1 Tax=Fluviicola sp. TaxID=1917219 RepID=UPI0040494624